MVPIDYFPDRMMDGKELEWLFHSALAANYNLLRVWGGGMYLTDEFYQMADKYGMLIWHDTSFSCKYYPYQSEEYIANAREEVREQVGRLQHHASIIYWVLNNEGIDMQFWRVNKDEPYYSDYRHFYIENLLEEVKDAMVNISRNFMDTSPTNGVWSFDPYDSKFQGHNVKD